MNLLEALKRLGQMVGMGKAESQTTINRKEDYVHRHYRRNYRSERWAISRSLRSGRISNWTSRACRSLVPLGSRPSAQTIQRWKIGSMAGIAMLLTVSVAIPAHAEVLPPSEDYLPGWVYEAPFSNKGYGAESRWICPEPSATIFDCDLYMWFHGEGYDFINKNLNKPSNTADGQDTGGTGMSAPIVSLAFMTVKYNARNGAGNPLPVTLVVPAPVELDYTTNRARVIFDLSDFFFEDFSDNSQSWGWNLDKSAVIDTPAFAKDRCLGSGRFSANPWEEYPEIALSCAVGGSLSTANSPTDGRLPFSAANASRAISMGVDVVKQVKIKSPTVEDGLVVWAPGSGINASPAELVTTSDNKKRKGIAFSSRYDWAAPTMACTTSDTHSVSSTATGGGGTIVKLPEISNYTTPSNARVLTWFATKATGQSCYAINSARYLAYSMENQLTNPHAHLTPEQWEKLKDQENIAKVNPEDYVRPNFEDCVSINPVDFRWDWPCIWDSLFVATPGNLAAVDAAHKDLLTRVPFNYFPLMVDSANKIFGASGSCSPWTVRAANATIPVFVCDASLQAVVRPITTWGFSIGIAAVVGTWVFRRFAPSFGGSS